MTNLLIGEYEHTLDDKKRISLPKVFRAALGRKVVVTRGLDSCLFVFSRDSWGKIAEKLQSLSFANVDTRGFNRFMLSGAAEVEVDQIGRILIPEALKKRSSLRVYQIASRSGMPKPGSATRIVSRRMRSGWRKN